MSDTVLIYGHSDDLIEIEGAISNEISVLTGGGSNSGTTIEFDDGARFRVQYDGEWAVEQLGNLPHNLCKASTVSPDDAFIYNDYSEVLVYQSWDGVETVEVVDE